MSQIMEYTKKFGRIGVLMGGYSSEREISLKSGQAIFESLKKQGCDVVALDIVDHSLDKISAFIEDKKMDIAFIALHGALGEDGKIQAILEHLNILYVGSGIAANKLAIDKIKAQEFFKNHNISIPKNFSLRTKTVEDDFSEKIKDIGAFPVVVKPCCGGSSIGISIVNSHQELKESIKILGSSEEKILIEKYIKGREFTVGILNNRPLPVIEVCPKKGFFDYSSKYLSSETRYIVPAQISEVVVATLQSVALKASRLLGCSGFARVDLIIDEDLNHYLLEVNTIPGFTSTSLLPKAANQAGLNFDKLCIKILEWAYGKKKESKDQSSCI